MLNALYPIVSGRVSDALTRNRSLYQTQVGQIELQRLQNQLNSGLQFTKPSENPIAALRVISIQRQIEYQNQRLTNLDSANSFLSTTDSNLSSIADVMNDVRGIAVDAATNTVTQDERDSWLQQIDTALARLQSLANTQHMDRYLFSGGTVATTTVANSNLPNSNGILFLGNDLSLNTIGGQNDYVSHNVTGQKALGLLSDSITGRNELNKSLTNDTRIADINSGRGASLGALEFSNGSEKVTIDISKSEFVGDILNKVNGSVSLAGREVSISIQNGGLQFAYADGQPGVLRVTDPAGGKTATDLGINSQDPAPELPFQGKPLSPITKLTTPLTDLNGGLGLDWNGGLRIRQGEQVYDVSFDGVSTIGEALNAIEASGAMVSASISADGKHLEIKSRLSGVDFAISEGNGNLAQQLGLSTFNSSTRLSELNYGRGIQLSAGADISIRRNDGSELQIDLDGAYDVQDVLDAINNHPDNQAPDSRILASISPNGGGFVLASNIPSPAPSPDPGPITIRSLNGSTAAQDLGLVRSGDSESVASSESGQYVVQGKDPNPQEVSGVFNSLLRLRDAISNQDLTGVARASSLIDKDLSKIALARGSLGIEQQRIESLKYATEDSKLQMESDQSELMDVDMVSAITELNARQVAYEASLRFLASANQMSLFNYL